MYLPIPKYRNRTKIKQKSVLYTVIDTYKHKKLGDLNYEYKIEILNKNETNPQILFCHEYQLRPHDWTPNQIDNFETEYHDLLLYELRRSVKLGMYDDYVDKTSIIKSTLPRDLTKKSPFFGKTKLLLLYELNVNQNNIDADNNLNYFIFSTKIKSLFDNILDKYGSTIKPKKILYPITYTSYRHASHATVDVSPVELELVLQNKLEKHYGIVSYTRCYMWFTFSSIRYLTQFCGAQIEDLQDEKVRILCGRYNRKNRMIQFKYNREKQKLWIEQFTFTKL